MLNYSIIIPTYNRAANLRVALNSLLSQDVNLEVVIIDDGSEDDTKEVVKSFEESLNINYTYQKNQGVSHARNTGLKKASKESDYLIFLDSDDYLEHDALKHVDQYLDTHNVKIAVMHMQIHKGSEIKMVKLDKFKLDYVSIDDDVIYPHYYIGGTIIANDIIKKDKLKFEEDIDFLEDTVFITKVIVNAGGYGIIKDAIYNYVLTEESPTKTKKRFDDVFDVAYPRLLKYFKQHKLSMDYLSYLIFYNQRFCCSYQLLSILNEDELATYQSKLRKFVKSLNLDMLEKLIPNDYRKKVLSYLIYDNTEYLKHKLRKITITDKKLSLRGLSINVELMKTAPSDEDITLTCFGKPVNPVKQDALTPPRILYINGIELMYPTLYSYQYRINIFRYLVGAITSRQLRIFYRGKQVTSTKF